MKPRFYDRHWLYPEITGQLSLIMPDDEYRKELFGLIENGDCEAIQKWIEKDFPDDLTQRLLKLGMPADIDESPDAQFDQIELGSISYADASGTCDMIYSRRVGNRFITWVVFDGSGTVVYTKSSDKPMTKRKFVNLTQWRPWLESGFEDEACDNHVSSIWDK